jgi:hypothetical protein
MLIDAPAIIEVIDTKQDEKKDCQSCFGDANCYRMSITDSVTNIQPKQNAVVEVLKSGLEQMREKNEALYFRVLHLEASNKRLKEQLKVLAEADSKIGKMALDALSME